MKRFWRSRKCKPSQLCVQTFQCCVLMQSHALPPSPNSFCKKTWKQIWDQKEKKRKKLIQPTAVVFHPITSAEAQPHLVWIKNPSCGKKKERTELKLAPMAHIHWILLPPRRLPTLDIWTFLIPTDFQLILAMLIFTVSIISLNVNKTKKKCC